MLQVLCGDALQQLRTLAAASVQCCVTSPPYWGLRDYGVPGQLGLEKTPEEYVAKIVEVFREVRRVLKDDGTCWINLGDSYSNIGKWGGSSGGKNYTSALGNLPRVRKGKDCDPKRGRSAAGQPLHFATGLKPKDLVGIPWMAAFALREDRWYLRQDIIWAKPNPMPESVRDRCTKAHEYLFLLSKSPRYFYDAEAIKEAAIWGDPRKPYCPGQVDNRGNGHARNGGKVRASVLRGRLNGKTNDMPGREAFRAIEDFRNKRSVWTVTTQAYPEAHFATFPPGLIKPCILAGTRPGDVVLDPFGGSGTTGMVSLERGRRAILIELNPDYVKLIEQRCRVTPGLALA